MTEAVTPTMALLEAPSKPKPPTAKLIEDVARKFGISPLRQFREMMRLCAGWRAMDFHEYYTNQVYRPELNLAEKMTYVGEKGSARLNRRLSPLQITGLRAFVRDKVMYGTLMATLGFPVPTVQAVFSKDRSYGKLRSLHDVEEIEAFLLNDAQYPLFVKPEEGSGSVGSALIVALDREQRALVLANGKSIDLRAFAIEVETRYEEGFLFQDAVQQHSMMSDVAGQAVGSIRVVTVFDGDTPSCLYALWKVPSPSAMSDNYWQPGSMLAELDKMSGQVLQCRRGSGPDQEIIERHPVSEAVFTELRIPHWDEVLRMAAEAHRVLPKFGVIGWDIAITPEGPLIIECNANPHHMLYQLATGKGIHNPDFAEVFDRVAARADAYWQVCKRKIKAERKRS